MNAVSAFGDISRGRYRCTIENYTKMKTTSKLITSKTRTFEEQKKDFATRTDKNTTPTDCYNKTI
jgi:hypothetical protein